MNTYESSQRSIKPVFAAIAVAATFATLGLAVVGPVALSESSAAQAQAAYRTQARPTEVAILPGTIEVVAKRSKVAHVEVRILPVSYDAR